MSKKNRGPKPTVVNVSSSTTVEVNGGISSAEFKGLLDLQETQIGELTNIKKILELTQQTQVPKVTPDAAHIPYKISEEILDTLKDTYKGSRSRWKKQEEFEAEWRVEAKNIAEMAQQMNTTGNVFQQMAKNLQTKKDNIKDKFSAEGLMKSFNIGGVFNKSIEKSKFMKQQKLLGNNATNEDFETAYKTSKDTKSNEAAIKKWQEQTGLGEEHMHKFQSGQDLLGKRQGLADTMASVNRAAHVFDPTGMPGVVNENAARAHLAKSPTQEHADAGVSEENSIEAEKHAQKQEELFTKIEQNTRGVSPDQKIKPKEEKEGGGLLGNLMGGGGMGKALGALKQFGVGIILVAGALFVAAKAFQQFAEVAWEDVGKGLVVLGGLVVAAIGLDKVKGSILAGAAALGVLGLVLWGVGAAFKTFSDLDWETIGKGMIAIAGLGVIGAVAGTAAPLIAMGAGALGLLGGALWIIGEAMQAVGTGFDQMTGGLERLSQLDGGNLLRVAAGVGALGLAMAAFGAGQAVAGLGNLVSRFLTIGTDSPVEQLLKIGEKGEGVQKAADGLEKLGTAMVQFGKIDKKSMEAINDFPWLKATAFVAAGGSMSVDGAKVYNASKGNADEGAKVEAGKGGGNTTVVNAPTQHTTKNTNMVRPQIRNQESSVSSWLSKKFA
jgi:hypothetical protein